MNAETLTALNESIAHWERLESGTQGPDEDIGPNHCALCRLFLAKGCVGCPVRERTRRPRCSGSPYYEAEWLAYHRGFDNDFRKAAAKELEFLKSLLPK